MLFQSAVEGAGSYGTIIALVLGLGIFLLILRFVFKLAMKAFLIGCVAIILLGTMLVAGLVIAPGL